jgi:NDP-sugar pyrophosphorylase family protein
MAEAALRGMVLAAGFGTRLKPLTDRVPKPLVPVANRPCIHFALLLLRHTGVCEIAVNLHHRGPQIQTALGDGGSLGVKITYSLEETILGTGGGLVRMRSFLQDRTFFLLNSDVLTAVDLEAVLRFHRERGAAATMVVRPLPPGTDYTPLGVDQEGFLVSFKNLKRRARGAVQPCLFEGVHVLEPAVFDFLPPAGFSCVADQGYAGLLQNGLKVAAYPDPGPWFDLGTPSLYLQANLAVLSGRAEFPQLPPDPAGAGPGSVRKGQDVSIGPGARLGPEVAVGDRCRIGAQAEITRSVLWEDSSVAPGARLDHVIVAGPHLLQL